MRAARYHEYGGPEVLQIDEVASPEPTEREVVVEVAAASVNPVDTYFQSEGGYEAFTMPMIPGSDVAGEVVAVGDGVEGVEIGDRVFATGLGRNHPGTYAEGVAVPDDRLAVLSDDVDLEAAAATTLVGVTAWRALVHHAGLEPGETCLIHGGSGGVGHVAVQLADAVGARVVATADEEYHDDLETLGADAVVDYARDDLREAVADASEGGPDVILDHRLDDYLQFDADVAAHGARIVGIGENDPNVGFTNDGAARGKELQFNFMSMFNTPDMSVPLRRLARLVDDGELLATVARRYDLDEAAEAQRAVMEDSFLGKLVIVP